MSLTPDFSAASTPADDADGAMRIEGCDKVWRNNKGELHRTDGPAVEYVDGSKLWYIKGQLHRTDGPAIEYANGSKSWYLNNRLHRADGPAVERANGSREWWNNGHFHRIDGPAIERTDGSKEWWVNGQLHRTDGPAIERADGSKEWWINDKKLTGDVLKLHLEKLVAERKALADAAHRKNITRLDQLAGRTRRPKK